MYAPPPVADFGGWYLRGDIGLTNQQVRQPRTDHREPPRASHQLAWASTAATISVSASAISSTTGSAPTSPVNIAAAPTSTARQSSRSAFGGGLSAVDNYTAAKSEWAVPGQRLCRSRHLVVRHAVHRRRRRHVAQYRSPTSATTESATPVGRRRRPRRSAPLRVEMEFRLGAACRSRLQGHAERDARTRLQLRRTSATASPADVNSFDGVNAAVNPMTSSRTSPRNDLKLGVRWNFDSPPVYAPPLVPQGLIERSHLLMFANGAGFSRAVLFCARSFPAPFDKQCRWSARQRLVKVNER